MIICFCSLDYYYQWMFQRNFPWTFHNWILNTNFFYFSFIFDIYIYIFDIYSSIFEYSLRVQFFFPFFYSLLSKLRSASKISLFIAIYFLHSELFSYTSDMHYHYTNWNSSCSWFSHALILLCFFLLHFLL